jgi:arsenate reductase-like glutaredoxin family protein
MNISIYHNRECGTSRSTLSALAKEEDADAVINKHGQRVR